jgi:hypothetical protein
MDYELYYYHHKTNSLLACKFCQRLHVLLSLNKVCWRKTDNTGYEKTYSLQQISVKCWRQVNFARNICNFLVYIAVKSVHY